MRKFICYTCKHKWSLEHGIPGPNRCPKCGSANIHRAPEDRGYIRGGRGRGSGQGRRPL